jgi:hypothetical protein
MRMAMIDINSCQEIDSSIAFVFDYEGEGVSYLNGDFTRWGEDGVDFFKKAVRKANILDKWIKSMKR